MITIVTIAVASAGCSADSSERADPPDSAAPDQSTTVPLTQSEVLAIGPSAAGYFDREVFSSLLNDFPSPPGVWRQGRFGSPDEGNWEYGFAPEPCTPAQRLDADELGPYEVTSDGIEFDSQSADGGFRLIWFDSEVQASTYLAAYGETCESYETLADGGGPRGLERTLLVETGANLDERMDEVAILSSEWRATANGRSWGNDILYSVQLENIVVEVGLFSGSSPDEMRPDAEALFLELVDDVEPKIRG